MSDDPMDYQADAMEAFGATDQQVDHDEPISSELALPMVMLRRALAGRKGIARRSNLCVLLTVPSEHWITPVTRAARKMSDWGEVVGISKPQPIDDQVRAVRGLADGLSLLLVSHAPERLVPAPLLAVSDVKLTIRQPDAEAIRAIIRLVTGKRCPQIPEGIASTLDLPTICGAIRKGSTPRQCLERLVAAAGSSIREDSAMRSVPMLDDLHGYGEAMNWCRRLAGDIDRWRSGNLEFLDIERMVVFASEPGLGKTSLVRSLAKTTGLPLFATSVGKWFSDSKGYLDSVIKEIDRVFTEAAKVGPAIVYLDELEGIPSRATMDTRSASWWIPVVGHMLTVLDGAASGAASRLVVIGATNHPEMLDPALVRSGRLSPTISIGRPDEIDLGKIFRQYLGGDLADMDIDALASVALGASGADVVEWVKGARARARSYSRALIPADLTELVAPTSALPAHVLRRIAVHEAGHAVVAQVLGVGEVGAVAMIGRGGIGGRTHVEIDDLLPTRESTDAIIMFILAGSCAERALLGSTSGGAGGSASSDLGRATEIVAANHASRGLGTGLAYRCDPEDVLSLLNSDRLLLAAVEKDLARLQVAADDVVRSHAASIAALAELLLRDRMVSGDTVRSIVALAGSASHG